MTRRSIVAAISICVHAIVLFVVMTADLWRPVSEWPTPRNAMAFVDPPRPVHIEDIPRRRTTSQSRTQGTPALMSPVLAPVSPPDTIGPETLQSPIVIESEHGTVIHTQLLRSIQLLDDAALTAVRQWKFSPTLLNGVPVPIVMTVTVNFKLD